MKTILLIDSGYLRDIFKKERKFYNADGIEALSHHIINTINQTSPLSLLRILFYDCKPFEGAIKLPISQQEKKFTVKDFTLNNLSARDYFAIRCGTLKFRGWNRKETSYQKQTVSDSDFEPSFEQKGVDMRIGLDIAQYAEDKSVDQIILISNDTDCIPAMKFARRGGIVMSLVEFVTLTGEIKSHADRIYRVSFPSNNSKIKEFIPKNARP